METINDIWTVFTVFQRKHKVDPAPPYQRGPVWQLQKQQLLIDSILRGYDIPKIYLRKMGGAYEHEVVDGQQRLRALWAFMADEYPLGSVSDDLDDEIKGKTFSELPEEWRDTLGLFKVSISEIRDATEIQVRELFLRLQEGVSLNPAEKRNAVPGTVRDFVAELGDHHPVFPALGISGKRFGWHEMAAIALRLEMSHGPTDLKAPDLMKMYLVETFDDSDQEAAACRATLDAISTIARLEPNSIKTRWGFVDLYLALQQLRSEIDLEDRAGEILQSHIQLDSERLEATGALDELLAADESDPTAIDPTRKDLFDYIQAFVRDGATARNVRVRHAVYVRRLRENLGLSASPPAA